jgi:hypothetical protein
VGTLTDTLDRYGHLFPYDLASVAGAFDAAGKTALRTIPPRKARHELEKLADLVVAGTGFEPVKLSRRIYSPPFSAFRSSSCVGCVENGRSWRGFCWLMKAVVGYAADALRTIQLCRLSALGSLTRQPLLIRQAGSQVFGVADRVTRRVANTRAASRSEHVPPRRTSVPAEFRQYVSANQASLSDTAHDPVGDCNGF